jgi:hypothetical protein
MGRRARPLLVSDADRAELERISGKSNRGEAACGACADHPGLLWRRGTECARQEVSNASQYGLEVAGAFCAPGHRGLEGRAAAWSAQALCGLAREGAQNIGGSAAERTSGVGRAAIRGGRGQEEEQPLRFAAQGRRATAAQAELARQRRLQFRLRSRRTLSVSTYGLRSERW